MHEAEEVLDVILEARRHPPEVEEPRPEPLDLPATAAVSPGGTAEIPVVVRANAGAATGDDYGFITLTQGTSVRRVPYFFTVARPGAEIGPVLPLKKLQAGDTREHPSTIKHRRLPCFGA